MRIIIEAPRGAGKTKFALKLRKWLESQDHVVDMYDEGEMPSGMKMLSVSQFVRGHFDIIVTENYVQARS